LFVCWGAGIGMLEGGMGSEMGDVDGFGMGGGSRAEAGGNVGRLGMYESCPENWVLHLAVRYQSLVVRGHHLTVYIMLL